MTVLGVTGGTGCGKTTLLRRAEAMGGFTVDCDAVYHELLACDGALLCALEARFPGTVEDGALNRRKLGTLVFGDPKALADLNALTHPFVADAVLSRVRAAEACGYGLAVIDAVALVESGLGKSCDATIAVTAPAEARIRRLMAREGIPESYARLRIAAQKSNAQFSGQCDRTIYNDYPNPEQFAEACDRLLLELTGGNKHE